MSIECGECSHHIVSTSPIVKCQCGHINIRTTRKYVIDFTVSRHGQFDMRAKSEEEARAKFKFWIADNKKETEQFINHFTFDYDIKTNYVYVAES